ncbi:AraC family transcriptional regulator [Streptomyces globosus]|uniref:AraC family transcriptional regulator n=1 Tax=Streptomyces globosus TaxID=68209 RepID=UPI0031D695C7
MLDGRMRLDCGRSGAYAAGGVLLAAAPGTPMRTAVEHMHARAAVLHPDLLRDVAGLPREAPIPPGLHTAAAPAETARWRACARYAWSLLDDGPAAAGPGTTLVKDAAARLLAAVALEAFPGFRTRPHPLAPGAGRVGPAALRRAAEFAHDHADGPVGPSDMAAAAGVPPRVLHAAFADALGTTPRSYLRRVRLTRARADLACPPPTRQPPSRPPSRPSPPGGGGGGPGCSRTRMPPCTGRLLAKPCTAVGRPGERRRDFAQRTAPDAPGPAAPGEPQSETIRPARACRLPRTAPPAGYTLRAARPGRPLASRPPRRQVPVPPQRKERSCWSAPLERTAQR